MISRRTMLMVPAALLAQGSSLALAAPRLDPVKAFDTDADGTLDLAEVKKAASALFAKLDRDPDHDGTLTLDEYLSVVEQRFKAANPDSDGTLDAKELSTPAGRALLRLLR